MTFSDDRKAWAVKYLAMSRGHVEWRSGENTRDVDDGGRWRRSSRDGTPVLISVGRGGGAVDGIRRVKDGILIEWNVNDTINISPNFEIFGLNHFLPASGYCLSLKLMASRHSCINWMQDTD